jgi:predicted DNA-binding transcriptional regulator AlpA
MGTEQKKYVRAHGLMARYCCSISTINRWEQAGTIPRSVKLNPGGPRLWVLEEIEASDQRVKDGRAA